MAIKNAAGMRAAIEPVSVRISVRWLSFLKVRMG
jgi:hypothetical protein